VEGTVVTTGGDGVVLLTGGAGYIGSHVAVELLSAGHAVAVVDNLSNSSAAAVERAAGLGGGAVALHVSDLRDEAALESIFSTTAVGAVVHLAGLKAVAESVVDPFAYYDTNVGATLSLLRVMQRHEVRRIVFSSSATIYGDPERVPVTEASPVAPVNPYGRTKAQIESILLDLATADPRWAVMVLRYFNPVGAHPSGRIGEDPTGRPNNLLPVVMQVALGRRPRLEIYGDDYPTPDGTCLRDYIHVVDLAQGHVAALEALARQRGAAVLNLGTGQPSSVREVLAAASAAVGRPLASCVVGRRPGDVAATWADPSAAAERLDWRARRDLATICADAWRWQSENPDGYR
jgi:UDP-glucose 4-epimerase